MAFGFNDRRVASQVQERLMELVNQSLVTSPKEEHEMVKMAGQLIDHLSSEAGDDQLVEFSASGSQTPSQGESYFNVNVRVQAIRKESAPPPPAWDPSQGPLKVERQTLPTADPQP